jgi:hypothetical protein
VFVLEDGGSGSGGADTQDGGGELEEGGVLRSGVELVEAKKNVSKREREREGEEKHTSRLPRDLPCST